MSKKKEEKYENTKLQRDLLKMPELESDIPGFNLKDQYNEMDKVSKDITDLAREHFEDAYYLQPKNEPISKALHDINTSYTSDGETTFIGRDEMGEEFIVTIPTIELLHWSNIKYWKEKSVKYINALIC
tara:strand:- start:9853 stop:10239 length:387 start_codon:yes stop_codon:yes gene_type:complete